ncbi:hypothetical protein [Dactylococcopsis salina]|uniref:Uncharacterized protein n=1 Tax=Dactylococcopsis salina (strain PCC 8305) TaxID=13035 RepID=K9YWM2_DACS8|nr:hypothetical protein [Dactylococcopsis salina]AFZ51321.1 hypothetical protein Dacsa_2747 [Dactylococcopsis salina PCC 8305]
MSRHDSPYNTPHTQQLLDTLADKQVSPTEYRQAMTSLGESFGDIFLNKITENQPKIYLASTVEDADYLAKGVLSRLETCYQDISFACFWNQRFSPFDIPDLQVAPILKKYQEPTQAKVNYLIIVKSIISGACVVKTNLTNLIQKIEPEQIFVVAPVIYQGAEEKLKAEFEEDIYQKFQFFYFARDDERNKSGEVIPGIGGMVYERLGFNGQTDKNKYVPEIVKTRRQKMLARS